MSLAWTTIKTALRAWVIASSGLAADQVIWSNQSAPQPAPPYATITPRVAIARRGLYDEERGTSTPGIIERVGQRQLTVAVGFYGSDAITVAEVTQDGLERDEILDPLRDAGLVVVDRGSITDLTTLLQTRFEERTVLDVVFGTASLSTEDLSWIETVEYAGTIDGVPVSGTIDT